jgi:hypothetical protein
VGNEIATAFSDQASPATFQVSRSWSATPGITGPGGGRIGAVVLSRFVVPGTVNQNLYNHYSLLATIEDIFGLGRLGFADSATPFGTDVFNQ